MDKKIIFVLVVLVLAGAGVLWYYYSPNNPATQQAEDHSNWKIYRSDIQGYQIQYPKDWGIELNSILEYSVTFGDPKNAALDVTVAVADAAAEKLVRDSLKINSETEVSIGGVAGQKLLVTGSSGEDLTVYLAVNGPRLYYIAGRAEEITDIVSTFQLFEPSK